MFNGIGIDYELVKMYHPDAPHLREVPSNVRHKRFQAVSAAYEVLQGKKGSWGSSELDGAYEEELKRRRRAFHAATARGNWDDATFEGDLYVYGNRRKWGSPRAEDLWKDRTIIWGSAFVSFLSELMVGLLLRIVFSCLY